MKTNIGYLLKEGIRNLWSNRMMTLASIGVLVACLLLTGSAVLFSLNITEAMATIENGSEVTVYLKEDVDTLEASIIGDNILNIDNVANCVFVDKKEALQDLLNRLGDDGTIYDGLFDSLIRDENFLPHAFKITFENIDQYKETLDIIKGIEGVDHITDYSEIAEKLTNLHKLVNILSFWIVVVLSLISLFIIANTIRVTMFSRRKEISIMKSVGATDGFIRFPFVIEGICIGLIAGLFATGVLVICYSALMSSITNLVPFFKMISLHDLIGWLIPAFLAAGCMFGALGGIISISRYLKEKGGEIIAS